MRWLRLSKPPLSPKKAPPVSERRFLKYILQTTVFLLCQVFIHSCGCFSSFAHWYLPLRAKTQGAVPKGMSVALIELVEMTATLNVVVSINSTTVMQTYWTAPCRLAHVATLIITMKSNIIIYFIILSHSF